MGEGRRYLKILLNILVPLGAIALVCILGPWLLRFFMPFVAGWIIAMIANPLVRFLEKRVKLVRKHSSVLIVVVALALVIGVLYFLISWLVLETTGFIKDLPYIYETINGEIQAAFTSLQYLLARFPAGIQNAVAKLNDNLGEYLSEMVQQIAFPTVTVAGNVAKRIPSVLVYTMVVILSSYFFIVERDKIMSFFKTIIPEWLVRYYRFFCRDMRHLLGGYFLAQFRIMFVVAAILVVGFWILGVSYAPLLALLIALLDFLPLFGTGTALIPWAVVKLLSGDYVFAIGLLLLYILTQVIRQIIQPKIVGDSMGLSPLFTLFLLYMGFKLRGISGMILAVPIGIIILNLYKYGAFDSLIENIKLLIHEIQEFRHKDE